MTSKTPVPANSNQTIDARLGKLIKPAFAVAFIALAIAVVLVISKPFSHESPVVDNTLVSQKMTAAQKSMYDYRMQQESAQKQYYTQAQARLEYNRARAVINWTALSKVQGIPVPKITGWPNLQQAKKIVADERG